MLPLTKLGNTDLEVTRLGFGSMDLRDLAGEKSMPQSASEGKLSSEAQAEKVLNTVLDEGINFIDTAWSYGRSEEFIGRFIAHRRSEFLLTSKTGHLYRNVSEKSSWNRVPLLQCLHDSLKKLKTDYLDILMLHNPRPENVENSNVVETLLEAKKAGKVRHIGLSSGEPHMDYFLGLGVFEVIQVPYSALMLRNGPAIEKASKSGVGVVVRGGMGEGVPFTGDPSRALYKKLKAEWEEQFETKFVSDTAKSEFLLRAVLENPCIDTVIVGSTNPAHIKSNTDIAKRLLS